MFLVRLRVSAGTVNDAVAMIRRRIEGIEIHGNAAGIDDVVLGPSSFKVFTISCNLSILLRFLEGLA